MRSVRTLYLDDSGGKVAKLLKWPVNGALASYVAFQNVPKSFKFTTKLSFLLVVSYMLSATMSISST